MKILIILIILITNKKDIETEDNKIEKMKEKPNIDLRKINNINTVNEKMDVD